MKYEANVSFTILFGEIPAIGMLAGQPVIPALTTLANEVDRVIQTIESETIRIIRGGR